MITPLSDRSGRPLIGNLDGVPTPVRVLVVDDHEDTARLSARILSLSGFEVQTALDGNRAVTAARSFKPDFILLDIGLPGLNGYEVAEILSKDESCAGSTLIAISGYGGEAALKRAKLAGFHHYLTKPVDFDNLAALIASTQTSGAAVRSH